ncbi:MAG: acyl carrier protein [Ruminococcaceae bacterium]|nr:acyl carrier protein [Oscillospiraceae bacterium]
MIEELKELLSQQLGIDVDRIDDDSEIINDLAADSLDIAELLMTLEDQYNVIIPDEEVAKLKTVRDVADYIEANS